MKNAFIITIVFMPLFFSGCAKSDSSAPNLMDFADFRSVVWGMSADEVKAGEKDRAVLKEDLKPVTLGKKELVYEENLFGHPVLLKYRFKNEQLDEAWYDFKIKHQNRGDYVNDFDRIKETVIKKYGTPDSEYIAKPDLKAYEGRREDRNKDFADNKIQSFKCSWEEGRTEISLSLMTLGDDLLLHLSYKATVKLDPEPRPPEYYSL
jgi:hypothetical protein